MDLEFPGVVDDTMTTTTIYVSFRLRLCCYEEPSIIVVGFMKIILGAWTRMSSLLTIQFYLLLGRIYWASGC